MADLSREEPKCFGTCWRGPPLEVGIVWTGEFRPTILLGLPERAAGVEDLVAENLRLRRLVEARSPWAQLGRAAAMVIAPRPARPPPVPSPSNARSCGAPTRPSPPGCWAGGRRVPDRRAGVPGHRWLRPGPVGARRRGHRGAGRSPLGLSSRAAVVPSGPTGAAAAGLPSLPRRSDSHRGRRSCCRCSARWSCASSACCTSPGCWRLPPPPRWPRTCGGVSPPWWRPGSRRAWSPPRDVLRGMHWRGPEGACQPSRKSLVEPLFRHVTP